MLTCRNLIGCPRTSVLPLETTTRGSRTKEHPLPSAHHPKIHGADFTLAHPSTVDVTPWGLFATLSGTLLAKVHDSRCRTRRAMRAARLRRASCASNARTDARGARARRVTQGENLFTLECAFAREIAARGDGLGKKSQSSAVSFIRRHPEGIGRMGTRGVRARAREARRGVESMRIIITSRRFARGLGAGGERRGRDAAHVAPALFVLSVEWED